MFATNNIIVFVYRYLSLKVGGRGERGHTMQDATVHCACTVDRGPPDLTAATSHMLDSESIVGNEIQARKNNNSDSTSPYWAVDSNRQLATTQLASERGFMLVMMIVLSADKLRKCMITKLNDSGNLGADVLFLFVVIFRIKFDSFNLVGERCPSSAGFLALRPFLPLLLCSRMLKGEEDDRNRICLNWVASNALRGREIILCVTTTVCSCVRRLKRFLLLFSSFFPLSIFPSFHTLWVSPDRRIVEVGWV